MHILGRLGRWVSSWSVASTAIVAGGCAFTLDFDKLERCASCKGVDACHATEHACVQNGCLPPPQTNPECGAVVSEPTVDAGRPRCADGAGLSRYSNFEPVEADAVLQIEVLTTSNRIFHSVYVSDAGKRDVILRAFDTTGETVVDSDAYGKPSATLRLSELLATTLDNDAAPLEIVAPLTMVPTPGKAGALTLYTVLAAPDSKTGDVVQLQLDARWPERITPTWLTDIPNFQVDDTAGRSGPAAGTLASGEPFVVWQGCKPDLSTPDIQREKDLCKLKGVPGGAGAIYGHAGSTRASVEQLATQGIAEDLPAGSLRALSGVTWPAALWGVSDLQHKQASIKAGLPSNDDASASELLRCDTEPGAVQWLNAAPIWGSISSVTWTRTPNTAEATRVQCLGATCSDLAVGPRSDAGADVGVDAGAEAACPTDLAARRVFADVSYLVHAVWADSTADDNARTLAAFVFGQGSGRALQVTVTHGVPDPNRTSLIDPNTHLELTTNNPTKVVLSLQKYAPKAELAVAAVGWVEPTSGTRQNAHLAALDLCLAP